MRVGVEDRREKFDTARDLATVRKTFIERDGEQQGAAMFREKFSHAIEAVRS